MEGITLCNYFEKLFKDFYPQLVLPKRAPNVVLNAIITKYWVVFVVL
jgi:hypothetical protein